METTSSLLPLRRKFLLSYEGVVPGTSDFSQMIVTTLTKVSQDRTDDLVSVNASCATASASASGLCGTEESRRRTLKDSTFAVIFVDDNPNVAETNARLFESLQVRSVL